MTVHENPAGLDALALELVVASSRFARTAGTVPGVAYSAIAWRVLADLARLGPHRVSALAQRYRVAQPSMTGLVQRLAAEEWVDRRPDPADGRATLVATTPAGESALAGYRRAAAARITPLLADLDDDERQTLARAADLMRRLSDSC